MKVTIELTEWEIKLALAKAIKEKTGLDLYTDKIKFQASVKVRNKARRKEVNRITATVETTP